MADTGIGQWQNGSCMLWRPKIKVGCHSEVDSQICIINNNETNRNAWELRLEKV